MTTSDSLEKEIIDELQRTGYPTEIVSASIMQHRRWAVFHNPSYLDNPEGNSREFDIHSARYWFFATADGDFVTGVNLITECKKSEKPWVFFVTPEDYSIARYGELIKWQVEGKQIFADNYNPNCFIPDEALRKFHHYFQKPYLARTFYEPFKRQEKVEASPMIYSAIMSCIKATLFFHQSPPSTKGLSIYYPLIIFSGNMFEAQVDSSKNISLTPSNHIQLSFSYILPMKKKQSSMWDSRMRFIIDVVHEGFLEQFLQTIEDEHVIIAEKLKVAFGT